MITIDPEKAKASANEKLVAEAAELLAKSDLVVVRCYERGQKIPKAWAAYRETLRHIVRGDPEAISSGIPDRPDYPA